MRAPILPAMPRPIHRAAPAHRPGRLSRSERRRLGVGRLDPRRFDRGPTLEMMRARRAARRRAERAAVAA
jgi:hypothetical protein